MAQSYIISEIKRPCVRFHNKYINIYIQCILVENRYFSYPTCIRRPRYRASRRNIAIRFDVEKLLLYCCRGGGSSQKNFRGRLPDTSFKVKRSKVKVTRLINADTHRAPCLWNVKAYELQTWYTDGERRPISATGAMTSKVKEQDARS